MTCVMGKPCKEHDGVVHGAEAEELRAGLEKLVAEGFVTERAVTSLLDSIDARDSLAFLEAQRKNRSKKR
jgi:hypothetical protein